MSVVGNSAAHIDRIMNYVLTKEFQAMFIGGLCLTGAWVVFSWLMQIIITLMWPILAFTGIMVALPSLRKFLIDVIIPQYMDVIYGMAGKISQCRNNTINS